MSWFEIWMRSSGPAALGTTLIHSLWEGAAVALGLAVALCFLRSAQARYGAACVAMICLVALPAITFTRLTAVNRSQGPGVGKFPTASVTRNVALKENSQASESQGPDDPSYLSWIAPFWLAGVLMFQSRAVAGWVAARRLRNTGVCCAPESWRGEILRLSARMRLSRAVTLLESCLAETPMVIGYLRPVILMPAGLLLGMPATQVGAILLHEMAHLRRCDYLVNVLQTFVEGLLFYHPAVWWISGIMRVERENCCDDLVVTVTGGAYEYARALAALEQNRAIPREALAATGGSLTRRIGRLLGREESRYATAAPVFAGIALICTVTASIGALQSRPIGPVVDRTARASVSTKQPVPFAIELPMPIPESLSSAPARLHVQMAQLDRQQPAQSANQPETKGATEPDKVLFEKAQQDIAQGNDAVALLTLNTLIRTYPDSEYVERAKAAINESLRGNLATPYKKWLDQEVVYIISGEERKAFTQLNTDEDRQEFVEQFWLRRDPTPGTSGNEFKEEIYRRINYANDHFSANIAGWRTDRGRIYIQYGPPDEKEAHPAGGTYQRPAEQGGGTTRTFPFEQWRYKFIEGIGMNVIIEFVDTTGSGDYRLTMDPTEKDILLRVPTPGSPEKDTRPSR